MRVEAYSTLNAGDPTVSGADQREQLRKSVSYSKLFNLQAILLICCSNTTGYSFLSYRKYSMWYIYVQLFYRTTHYDLVSNQLLWSVLIM